MSDPTAEKPKDTDESEPSFEPLGSPTLWPSPTRSDPEGHFTAEGLYVDTTFPLDEQLAPEVEWKRPKEICSAPQFIIDGATRMDVCQGILSDCWFLSAIASLSLHPSLMRHVVPSGQSFQDGYNGSFKFRFWQYGEWKEVKIDDRLPTQRDQLIYLRSSQTNEFWSSLLEKAYAKLKGGYRALNMGFSHEAMADMTGGVTEVLKIPRNLAAFLKPLLLKGALINCANSQGPLEQKNEFGILFKHAYAVTGLEQVQTKNGPVELVRVHNPWGKTEWEGPWSDQNGSEWNLVSAEEQRRLKRVNRDDGEFWMTLSDFRQNFDLMEVCHLSDDTLSEGGVTERPWHVTVHHGNWTPNLSAGGPSKGGWFWQNPQFHLTLLEEDDDPTDPELTCSFLVALMQKHQRLKGVHLAIGLDIYEAHTGQNYLSTLDLSLLRPVLSTEGHVPHREVVIRGRLAPGRYIIIPSTLETNQAGEFLLRVLTEKGNNAEPSDRPSSEKVLKEQLFKKHCNKKSLCRPLELYNLLTEAIAGGALAGAEKKLCLEHCKSFVVLMDNQGLAQLDWYTFLVLWNKFTKWTEIFVKFDKNKSHALDYREIVPAMQAAGLEVDDFILQLVSLRYTEPDMTISYPGFLYLLTKMDSMLLKFQALDMVGMGVISVNCRQWLQMTMYN
ncbi:calpain-9 [Chanos chanos]|uniref:Calpain-9 n=1 Tax=Chanos chanos TaxID=29144 RepID=A0A6J2VKX9_CHACN|nr:calpain-9-like [Chanos chanos]